MQINPTQLGISQIDLAQISPLQTHNGRYFAR
jgi:hypothetical protein